MRFCASNAGGMSSIPSRGIKIPHVVRYGQKKKVFVKFNLTYGIFVKQMLHFLVWQSFPS